VISVSRRCRSHDREYEPPLPASPAEVDSLEDGSHLGGRHLDTMILGLRKRKTPRSNLLAQIARPSRSTIQDLQPVTPAIAEHEEMTGEGILADD